MLHEPPIRVLVVDDSAVMRRALSGFLDDADGFEVVGTAENGRAGIDAIERFEPDAVTLDIEMPEMDGLTALRKLRLRFRERSPAVLMCSSLTREGSWAALEAMRLGAADAIGKDPAEVRRGGSGFVEELLNKLRAIAGQRRRRAVLSREEAAPPNTAGSVIGSMGGPRAGSAEGLVSGSGPASETGLLGLRANALDAVLIGSSTGGPPVLETLVAALSAAMPFAVVIAQHMPAMFTRSLAERLDERCPPKVVLAEDGMPVLRGTVYVAEGGHHTRLARVGGRLKLVCSAEPRAALYKPSVDELFRSGVGSCGRRVLGLVLTGMGEDGAEGARSVSEAGGVVLAQDEASCVVFGMPGAVAGRGLARALLPPEGLARVLGDLSGAGVPSVDVRWSA